MLQPRGVRIVVNDREVVTMAVPTVLGSHTGRGGVVVRIGEVVRGVNSGDLVAAGLDAVASPRA
jgi:Zn-dependent alcohol dehydrogenase